MSLTQLTSQQRSITMGSEVRWLCNCWQQSSHTLTRKCAQCLPRFPQQLSCLLHFVLVHFTLQLGNPNTEGAHQDLSAGIVEVAINGKNTLQLFLPVCLTSFLNLLCRHTQNWPFEPQAHSCDCLLHNEHLLTLLACSQHDFAHHLKDFVSSLPQPVMLSCLSRVFVMETAVLQCTPKWMLVSIFIWTATSD